MAPEHATVDRVPGAATRQQLRRQRRRPGPLRRAAPVLVVCGAVVLVYLPFLIGVIDSASIAYVAGLTDGGAGGVLPGAPFTDPNVGITSLALGHLAATDLVHLHMPWWNPYEGVGLPLAAEMQSAALLPFTLLLAVPVQGQVLFHMALQITAGLATYGLLRELHLSRWAACTGAVLFAVNGSFALLTNAAFNPVAFLPVMLWGVERCRRPELRARRTGGLLVAAGLALSLYAGFPETALLDALLVLVWAVLRSATQPSGDRWRLAGRLGAAGAVGLALAAPALGPFAEYLRVAALSANTGALAYAHLPLSALHFVGAPYVFGNYLAYGNSLPGAVFWGAAYLTMTAVVMALFGLLSQRDRALRVLLGCWLGLTLLAAYGFRPAQVAVNLVPGVNRIIFYRYIPPTWWLAVSVLVAIGLDGLGAPDRRRRATLTAAVAAGAALAVLAFTEAHATLRLLGRLHNFSWYPIASFAWLALTLLVIATAGLLARPGVARRVIGAILVLDALVMFAVPELTDPRHVRIDTAPLRYLHEHEGLARVATVAAGTPPLYPNFGSYYGVAEVDYNDTPVARSWIDFVATRLDTNTDALQFDGTYVARPSGPTALQELRRHLAAYEAVGVRYIVSRPGTVGVPGRVVFSDPVAVISEVRATPFYSTTGPGCRLGQRSLATVTVSCARPTELIRRELYVPGWSASRNGHPVPVSRHGPLFMAVHVPAGTSAVSFTYEPPGIGIDVALFAAAVVALLVGYLLPIVRNRPLRRPRDDRGARRHRPRERRRRSGGHAATARRRADAEAVTGAE